MRNVFHYILLFSLLSMECGKDKENSNTANNSYNHGRFPGKSAVDFLAAQNYKSLNIELDYMPGFKPDARSISLFAELVSARLNKPNGIVIIEKQIDPTLKTIITLDDINAIESGNRSAYTSGDQMSAYILITNGSYYINNVIGMAYKNTSICFFGEQLSNFTIGTTQEEKVRAVAYLLFHEFGHLLGLVDMGSAMTIPHRDLANGNHCDNNTCIMHHSFEPINENIPRIISGTYYLDANCISDLVSNGGK